MRMTTAMFKRSAAIVGLMSLLWILSTLMIPSSSHAAIFFDDSFETCVVGGGASFPCEGWDDFGQEAAGTSDVATDQVFSGMKSYKQTLTKKDLPIGNLAKPSIYKTYPNPKGTRIFARWAIKWSNNFEYCTINGVTKIVRFVLTGGFPKVWIINYFGTYTVLVEAPYFAGAERIETGVSVTSGSWDQIEFEWKLNTPGQANGEIRFWVNGVLRAERTGREYIGPTPTSFHPIHGPTVPTPSTAIHNNTQIYVQCGIGNIWYDRFAVGNTRIGLTTGQPSGDTTPPASPQGLQAR